MINVPVRKHGGNALLIPGLTAVLLLPAVVCAADASGPSPEERAVAFLAREVPGWSHENHCFSCHNNGDAARALYQARSSGMSVPSSSLDDTTDWLTHPERWDRNGGDGPFSDKKLARVQFTAALVSAFRAKQVTESRTLAPAAERLSRDQAPDGSWPLDGDDGPGSPATYGRALATHLARESLHVADHARFRHEIQKADRWLLSRNGETVMDGSVMLLACASLDTTDVPAVRRRGLERLRRGQADDGGWGLFIDSPPEAFDTALALLALARSGDSPEIRTMIARGRRFLIASQQDDGGWIATTRPPGAESYAQRISTTGWAALALIATRSASFPLGTNPER